MPAKTIPKKKKSNTRQLLENILAPGKTDTSEETVQGDLPGSQSPDRSIVQDDLPAVQGMTVQGHHLPAATSMTVQGRKKKRKKGRTMRERWESSEPEDESGESDSGSEEESDPSSEMEEGDNPPKSQSNEPVVQTAPSMATDMAATFSAMLAHQSQQTQMLIEQQQDQNRLLRAEMDLLRNAQSQNPAPRGEHHSMVSTRNWKICNDLTSTQQLKELEEDLRYRDVQRISRCLRSFMDPEALKLVDMLVKGNTSVNSQVINIGEVLEPAWHGLKGTEVMKIIRTAMGATSTVNPVEAACQALKTQEPPLMWHGECCGPNMATCQSILSIVGFIIPEDILESPEKDTLAPLRDVVEKLLKQTDFGNNMLISAGKLRSSASAVTPTVGRSSASAVTPTVGDNNPAPRRNEWAWRTWFEHIVMATNGFAELKAQFEQQKGQSDGHSANGQFASIVGGSRKYYFVNRFIGKREDPRSDKGTSGDSSNKGKPAKKTKRDAREAFGETNNTSTSTANSKEIVEGSNSHTERPLSRTERLPAHELSAEEVANSLPCCACGHKKHAKKDCFLAKGLPDKFGGKPHPEVNTELKHFAHSTRGKQWKKKGKDMVTFSLLLDGSRREGKRAVNVVNSMSDDIVVPEEGPSNDIVVPEEESSNNIVVPEEESSKSDSESEGDSDMEIPDGMIECLLMPPTFHKSNSNPTPSMTQARRVRVLLDNGSLGRKTSYVDVGIAKKLRRMGYKDRKCNDSVCTCVGTHTTCSKLTKFFKLNLSFTDPVTKQRVTKQIKAHVTKLTHRKQDPQVIVGLRDIRREKIFKAIVMEMMTRPNPNSDRDSEEDDDEDEDTDINTTFAMGEDDIVSGESVKSTLEGTYPDGKENDQLQNTEPVIDPELCETKTNYQDWSSVPEKDRLGIKNIGTDDELSIEDTLQVCKMVAEVFSRELRREPARIKPLEIEVDPSWFSKENQQPPRQVSRQKEEEIRQQVATMVAAKVVGSSKARAHSQVTLAKKPDGTWRFCIDFRRLNVKTKDDCKWPIPRIDAMLQRLGAKKSKYYAILDLTKGYYQAPLAEWCRHLTAFITPDGVYEWMRVAMGLKGAPSYFQRAMATEVLNDLLYECCEVYLDDIIVFGRTKEEYLANLEKVLRRLNEFNVTVNPKKCQLGLTEVEYVGHVINREGVTFSPEKLQKALSIDKPKTEKQLKSFLGVANYFRDHIQNHSSIVAPLHALMLGYSPRRLLNWTPEAETAFEQIRHRLLHCPKLFWIDDNAPIHLYTDASKLGVGAYLCQERDGKQVPIRFFSKSLNKSQKEWDVPRLEAYAIYAAFKEFDYLLRDVHTHIHTDHENLVFIKDSSSEVVIRWKMQMMCYSFDISHIRGVDNEVADYWSRLEEAPLDTYDLSKDDAAGNHVVANMLHFINPKDECDKEHEIKPALAQCNWLHYFDEEKETVTKEHRELIESVHNCEVGHHGVERTMELLKQKGVQWKGMLKDVRRILRACHTCQKMDVRTFMTQCDHYTVGKYRLFDRLNIDTVGPYPRTEEGYDHVVVIIDSFSRYMTLYPTKGIDGPQAADALLHHMGNYGAPNEVLSDGGPEYANKLIEEFLNMTGTEHLLTIAYSKQENSIVERSNKEVNRWVRDILYDRRLMNTEWLYYLPFVQRIHNATTVKPIGASPADLVYGDRVRLNRNFVFPTTPMENKDETIRKWSSDRQKFQEQAIIIAQEITAKHEAEVAEYNKREGKPTSTKFQVGELVLLAQPPSKGDKKRKNKLDALYTGPYEVVQNEDNQYLIKDLITNVPQNVGVWRLKPYQQEEGMIPKEGVANHDHKKEFFVEKVLSHTGSFKRMKSLRFLIKWEDFDDKFNTEEPWSNVYKSTTLQDYLRSIGKEKYIVKETAKEAYDDTHVKKRRR